MKNENFLKPITNKKAILYALIALILIFITAISLSFLDGGMSFWRLILTVVLAGIPILMALAMVAWLNNNAKQAPAGISGNSEGKIRIQKVMPYIILIIILFALIKIYDILF